MANWYSAPAPIARRVRAYFAPVNRATQTPAIFDPSRLFNFNLDAPPAPWLSLGWIQEFVRKPLSKSASVLTGIPATTLEQVRESVGAQVGFQFLSWTKLTMALATGSQHMNVLAPASGSPTAAADGGTAAPAVTVQTGSTSTTVALTATDAAKFAPGSIIAIDVDNTGATGYVGSPISGAYLRAAVSDVDYIRRITFNVALVSQSASTGLTLAEPLPAGAPSAGLKLQAVVGFVDREGGSFYQEWSGLFVVQGSQGERILFYYPRLQTIAGAEESNVSLTAKGKGTLGRVLLSANFQALPVTDPLDGERVVCYRSFVPAPNALV
jgi:hypothetical protein